jgi:hypothetical protein
LEFAPELFFLSATQRVAAFVPASPEGFQVAETLDMVAARGDIVGEVARPLFEQAVQ